eukprot:3480488-Pyramimonas_sp.AAC.1
MSPHHAGCLRPRALCLISHTARALCKSAVPSRPTRALAHSNFAKAHGIYRLHVQWRSSNARSLCLQRVTKTTLGARRDVLAM